MHVAGVVVNADRHKGPKRVQILAFLVEVSRNQPMTEKLNPVDQQLETDQVAEPGRLTLICPHQYSDVCQSLINSYIFIDIILHMQKNNFKIVSAICVEYFMMTDKLDNIIVRYFLIIFDDIFTKNLFHLRQD